MSEIKRWEHREDRNGMYQTKVSDSFGVYITEFDHVKAMETKDDLIDGLSDGLNDKDIKIEAQAKEIERLKAKAKDYKAGAKNWEANAKSWRDDFHELTDNCKSCHDKVFNKELTR